jgi:hypothetical protein
MASHAVVIACAFCSRAGLRQREGHEWFVPLGFREMIMNKVFRGFFGSAAVTLSLVAGISGCAGADNADETNLEVAEPEDVGSATQALFQDGCSTPWAQYGLPAADPRFNAACAKHDHCYHSGRAAYNLGRDECDSDFFSMMLDACEWKGLTDPICAGEADVFYGVVRAFGDPHFKSTRCTSGEAYNSKADVDGLSCSSYELFDSGRRPAFPSRVTALLNDGTLLAKDSDLSSSWVTLTGGVSRFVTSGFRVAGLFNDGRFMVKEGNLSHVWVDEHGGVRDVAMNARRLAVLLNDGTLKAKEDGLGTAWVTLIGGVTQTAVFDNRVGALTSDGTLRVKEGSLSATWVNMHSGVKAFALQGKRVAILLNDGTLKVKDGALSATWVTMIGSVRQFAMSGSRVAALTTDGTLRVKDGNLSATWAVMHGGVSSFAMAGNRVGVLLTDGNLKVKEGSLSASWVNETAGAAQFALSGNRIGALLTNGTLVVKEGGLSASWVTLTTGVRAFSLVSAADWPI